MSDTQELICAECKCRRSDPTDYLCEGCRAAVCGCKSTPTFGIAPVDNPLFFGGHVDADYYRHDPMRHAKDCPYGKAV